MIVDAARDRRVFPLLLDCRLEQACLYSGPLNPALELAAPYLIQLEYEDGDTRRLLEQAWGNNWGVFLKSDTRMDKLRRHLQGFLLVLDPRGKRMVFRYYDPRVLRAYLPTCTVEELRTVYGPVECFWTEDKAPETGLEFRFDKVKLATKRFSIDLPAATARAAG